ncbi:MAG TPA: PPC domain-containing DNA-binding protein [Bryobacteraceae bacterium]|nr:PPC domain-containing DNA-binding protein [Bryobacteraceae bacterium]
MRNIFVGALVWVVAGGMGLPAQTKSGEVEYIQREAPVVGGAPGMKVKQLSSSPYRTFYVTLARGDEVTSGMTEFAEKYHIRTASVTAVGAFSSAILGWTDLQRKPPAMRKIPINEEVEVSMNGNITPGRDGKPAFHGHVFCALSDGSVKGGHMYEAKVGIIMQLTVTELEPSAETKTAE